MISGDFDLLVAASGIVWHGEAFIVVLICIDPRLSFSAVDIWYWSSRAGIMDAHGVHVVRLKVVEGEEEVKRWHVEVPSALPDAGFRHKNDGKSREFRRPRM